MCFGGGPQQPQIVYTGPSEDDLRAGQESLDAFAKEIEEQNAAINSQIQSQIDAGNAAFGELQSEFDAKFADLEAYGAEQAAEAIAQGNAQAAAANATNNAAYSVNTAAETLKDPQTTKPIPDKRKEKKANLKINTAGALAQAGAGINLGI